MKILGVELCCTCRSVLPAGTRGYCNWCKNYISRLKRAKYTDLSPQAKQRADARSHAKMAQRRGKIIPQPCEVCGATPAEKHHDDYSDALKVRWLCRVHHLEHHGKKCRRVETAPPEIRKSSTQV